MSERARPNSVRAHTVHSCKNNDEPYVHSKKWPNSQYVGAGQVRDEMQAGRMIVFTLVSASMQLRRVAAFRGRYYR